MLMLQGYRTHLDKDWYSFLFAKNPTLPGQYKTETLGCSTWRGGIFTSTRCCVGTVLKLPAAVTASWWAPLSVHYYGGWGIRRWVSAVPISKVVMIVMSHVIFIIWWAVQRTQWRYERVICATGWWRIHLAVNWNNKLPNWIWNFFHWRVF